MFNKHILFLADNKMQSVYNTMFGIHRNGPVISCWLVGFVALRPKSTAMVIAGRSVHLTTLFPGQA